MLPVGEAFLVVVAARRSVAPSLYEAAALEGCSPAGQLRRLTVPLLAPVLVLLAARDTLVALQAAFVPGYVLTDGATRLLPLYVFDQSFEVGCSATAPPSRCCSCCSPPPLSRCRCCCCAAGDWCARGRRRGSRPRA